MSYWSRITLSQDQCSGDTSYSWSYSVDNEVVSITGTNIQGTVNTDATEIFWTNGYTYKKIGTCVLHFPNEVLTLKMSILKQKPNEQVIAENKHELKSATVSDK